MRRNWIIIILLLLGALFLYFKYFHGWLEFRRNTDTPKEFISHTLNSKSNYSKDSIEILKQLQYYLDNHKQSFYKDEYFEFTELSVDTILYSPDFNKLAVFAYAKNPTYRLSLPSSEHQWHYSGFCYLGTRDQDSIHLSWILGGYKDSYDFEDTKNSMEQYYYRMFSAVKDRNNMSQYKYNLNDIRFWNGPIWKDVKDKNLGTEIFENGN